MSAGKRELMELSFMDKACAAWGEDLPGWLRALAEACDANGQKATARRLGVSDALLSLTINRKRKSHDLVRQRVESVITQSITTCPVLGVIGKDECQQAQASPFSAANPLQVRLYKACRSGCAHFTTST